MAQFLGGAELYPSCIQLAVTGNSKDELSGNEYANFPGAYKPTDPGLHVDVRRVNFCNPVVLIPRLQVYTDFQGDKYQFPGPPVAAFS